MTYRILLPLAALLWMALQSSCTKQDFSPESLLGRWEVTRLVLPDGATASPPETYTVEFLEGGLVGIRLGVNHCSTGYEVANDGDILLGESLCTRVCCDSSFATRMVAMLPDMTQYYVQGRTLHLTGEGRIRLRRL